jgi:hypothetical protein
MQSDLRQMQGERQAPHCMPAIDFCPIDFWLSHVGALSKVPCQTHLFRLTHVKLLPRRKLLVWRVQGHTPTPDKTSVIAAL